MGFLENDFWKWYFGKKGLRENGILGKWDSGKIEFWEKGISEDCGIMIFCENGFQEYGILGKMRFCENEIL